MLSRVIPTARPAIARAAAASTTRAYSDEGSVRQAGGSFAKREAAQEEQYFRKKNAEKTEHLKEELDEHYHADKGAKKPAAGADKKKAE